MQDCFSRRKFLLSSTTAVSAAWVTASWPAILAAARHAQHSSQLAAPPKFEYFTPRVPLCAFFSLIRCGLRVMVILAGATVLAAWASSKIAKSVGANPSTVSQSQPTLRDEGGMPDLGGATGWLNSPALNRKTLRGKVVLIDFWTYTCINSLRPLPYVKGWAAKYKDAGLVIIGVHSPEFSFERERENVQNAVHELAVNYPVAIDSDRLIWQAFDNKYWPAQFFIDGKGRIRYHHFGEGDYGELERVIQKLLIESGAVDIDTQIINVSGHGVEAAPSNDVRSPETYLGYRLTQHFASPQRLAQDSRRTYDLPARLALNQWSLSGSWKAGEESVVPQESGGKIVLRFHSRDLHLVLSPGKRGQPVRFRVTLDGLAPGGNCGADVATDGSGEVREPRLYQLIRQKGTIEDRTFEIEFLDSGVQALDFTFG